MLLGSSAVLGVGQDVVINDSQFDSVSLASGTGSRRAFSVFITDPGSAADGEIILGSNGGANNWLVSTNGSRFSQAAYVENRGAGDALVTLWGGEIDQSAPGSSGPPAVREGAVARALGTGNALIVSNGTNITTGGSQSPALFAGVRGTNTVGTAEVVVNGGTLRATGALSVGVQTLVESLSATADTRSIIRVTDATVTSGRNDGLFAANAGAGTAEIYVENSTINAPAQYGLRPVSIGGDFIVSVDNSVVNSLFGAIQLRATGSGNIATANNADIFIGPGTRLNVSDPTGYAIEEGPRNGDNAMTTTLTIDNSDNDVVIQHDILLKSGDDRIIFIGNMTYTDASAVGDIDGGENFDASVDNDEVTFRDFQSPAVIDMTTVTNWEAYVIDNSDIAFDPATLPVAATLEAPGGVSVINGGTLRSGDLAIDTIAGVSVSNGTIALADGTAGQTLTINGSYSGVDARLWVDTDASADISDVLLVNGDVIAGGLTAIVVSDVSAAMATGNDILVVDVSGASPAGVFVLDTGPVKLGGILYQLEQIGADWYLTALCNDDQTVASAVPSVLGCVTPDTLTVTTGAVIAGNVEGAGGVDIIRVEGDATVAGIVHGGQNGLDGSAADDLGDFITIDTTGSIAGVNGDLGDDQVWVLNGTVTGNVLGEAGNDTIQVAAGSIAGDVNGGDGADTIRLTGGTIGGNVLGGTIFDPNDGADIIVLDGAVIGGLLAGGSGDDRIELRSGSVALLVSGDDGDDVILASGGSTDRIVGHTGSDRIELSGTITVAGLVSGGDDNDFIEMRGGSAGAINGGNGADEIYLRGGAVAGIVRGDNAGINNDGDDLIELAGTAVGVSVLGGGGDDRFAWSSGATPLFDGEAGSDTAQVTAAEYDGSQILDGGDDTSNADGMIDELTFSGRDFVATGANILNWESVLAEGITLAFSDGAITVGGDVDPVTWQPTNGLFAINGGTLDFGSAFTVTGNLGTADAVSSILSATSDGTGVYNVLANPLAPMGGVLYNAGTVDMTGAMPAAGDTMTVAGSYWGGGSLLMDAALDATGEAGLHDLLVIGGDVHSGLGTTQITVSDVGDGIGNYTGTGAGAGVPLVDVSATGNTVDGDFALSTGPIIVGAFTYDLNLETDGIWYLQSAFLPSVPTYEAYAQSLLGLMTVPTLQQRIGNRYWREAGAAPAEPTYVYCKDALQNFQCAVTNQQADYYAGKAAQQARIDNPAIWARIEGAQAHGEPASSTTGVSSVDTDHWQMQAGVDVLLNEGDDGSRLFGSITGHYGKASSDIASAFGDGSIDTTGHGVGATLTWLGANGGYLDLQGSVTWFDSELSSDVLGSLEKGNDGFGHALSAEIGKKFFVDEATSFTPQAQLSWASVDFDSFTGPNGEKVSLDDADSLKLRLGISGDRDRTWVDADGMTQRSHVYAIANVIHEFEPESTVVVSGTPLSMERDQWTGEIGLGFTRNFDDDKYSIYGEVNASTGLENFGDSHRLGGTLGVRMSF